MNFLAHAFLSFNDENLLIGNLITDFLHGTLKSHFPDNIRQGIRLHYEIDTFTDTHPSTLLSKEYFRPSVGRYCVVFQDVVYDYFLANDPQYFSDKGLMQFSREVYATLDKREDVLPERFKRLFFYMKKENWLYHYKTDVGIKNSFNGVFRRARYLKKTTAAFEVFQENKEKLREAYAAFMPEMVAHAKEFLKKENYF